MNKFLGIFILLFALNCKSVENQAKMKNENVVLIGKGNLYGSGAEGIEQQNTVITSTEDWNNLLEKINSVNNVSQNFSETKIDFSKFTVIAVFEDVKSSGGYSLELDIQQYSETIKVNVIRKSPEGMATTVMAQPYYIVKVLKQDLPINFVEN
jgi:hypothetical protein